MLDGLNNLNSPAKHWSLSAPTSAVNFTKLVDCAASKPVSYPKTVSVSPSLWCALKKVDVIAVL